MQAALLTAPRTFQIQTICDPKPKAGEVMIRVRCAGVCGSDIHFYDSGRIGEVVLCEPFLMGHEFGGIIEDSCGVPGCPPVGTRVAVDPAIPCGECIFCQAGRSNICPQVHFTGFPPYPGAFAERVAVPLENVFPMPDTVSDEEGPLLETLAVALHAVELVPEVRGKSCVVLGAGPVGILTALVLRSQGARVVLITEPVSERRNAVSQMTSAPSFHPDDTDGIRQRISHDVPHGPEIIFETAGEPESYQMALDRTRPGGQVVIIGIYPRGTMPVDFTNARRKELSVVFVRRSLPRNYPDAIRLASEKKIDLRPLATHVYPLERIGEAFSAVHYKTGGVIKAVIQP